MNSPLPSGVGCAAWRTEVLFLHALHLHRWLAGTWAVMCASELHRVEFATEAYPGNVRP
jgi:hypothetical protein